MRYSLVILAFLLTSCANLAERNGNVLLASGEMSQTTITVSNKFQPVPEQSGNIMGRQMEFYPYKSDGAITLIFMGENPYYYNLDDAYGNKNIINTDRKCSHTGLYGAQCYTFVEDCMMTDVVGGRVDKKTVAFVLYSESMTSSDYSCASWNDPDNWSDDQRAHFDSFMERCVESYSISKMFSQ